MVVFLIHPAAQAKHQRHIKGHQQMEPKGGYSSLNDDLPKVADKKVHRDQKEGVLNQGAVAVNGVENGIASATNGETAAKVANFSATSTVKNLGSNGVKALVSVAAPSNTSTLATAGENGADLLYTFTKADETVRITAYIWMEGCDYDCNNTVVNNIQGHIVNCQLGFALAAPENS